MSKTIILILLPLATLSIAFCTSLLFEVPLVQQHWTRTALVLILMLLELVVGFGMCYILAINLKMKK